MSATNRLFSYNHDTNKIKLSLPAADIIQISELSIMRGTEIEPHDQFCDEITYAISGNTTVYSDDGAHEISRGQIHFIKKGGYHKIVANENENFRFVCIGYHPKPKYPQLSHIFKELSEQNSFIVTDNGNVRILAEMLINESYMQGENSGIMINAYITQILTEMLRAFHGNNVSNGNKYENTNTNLVLYRTLRCIDHDFLEINNIKELAKKLSYSEYYLAHMFKDKMGVTLKEYILKKKMDFACTMLSDSSVTVREVSEKLGYSAPHSFSQAFTKCIGMTPTDYRKANL